MHGQRDLATNLSDLWRSGGVKVRNQKTNLHEFIVAAEGADTTCERPAKILSGLCQLAKKPLKRLNIISWSLNTPLKHR